MKDQIKNLILQSSDLKRKLAEDNSFVETVRLAAEKTISTIKNGGTVYACGNGGSACDSIHFVEELVARFKKDRPGIKAHHLIDPGMVTCWANDYSFETIFSRQVETYCNAKDILFCFSTSGNSANVLKAIEAAKTTKTLTVGLTGNNGGKMKDLCDITLVVPSPSTARIQEVHITVVHILCELIEGSLYP